ncbi:MAG: hypothetical protein A2086_14455, partial [Spirochaetes bacterium GWD1_27_9]
MKNFIRNIIRQIKAIFGKDYVFRKQQKGLKYKWVGNLYGGFYVAPQFIDKESIVYSFGIGEDTSFDEDIIKEFGCNVYGFDPTPKSIQFVKNKNTSSNFHFYQYGIDSKDGFCLFYPPEDPNFVSCSVIEKKETKDKAFEVQMKKFSTIVAELGHKKIDLLKMDIEGGEYSVIEDIIKTSIPIKQILIEFHHRFLKNGVQKTKNILNILNNNGFKIFAVSKSG